MAKAIGISLIAAIAIICFAAKSDYEHMRALNSLGCSSQLERTCIIMLPAK